MKVALSTRAPAVLVPAVMVPSAVVTVPEIWNPTTNQWRMVAPMSTPRGYHVNAILLRDGRVLVTGGGLCGCVADHPNSEIYSPGYLFNADGTPAARPTIDLVSPDLKPGLTVWLKGSDDITAFRLIRLQATTHGINTDQHYVPVNFTKVGTGNYNLSLDSNQNVLLPGMYWLFALNANGTPSMGATVQPVRARASDPGPDAPLSERLRYLLACAEPDGRTLEALAAGLGVDRGEVATQALACAMQGTVRRLPGGLWRAG